jgi:hypothetical protein
LPTVIWDRCYEFKNISAETFGENIGDFDSNSGYLGRKIAPLVFKKNSIFSPENW